MLISFNIANYRVRSIKDSRYITDVSYSQRTLRILVLSKTPPGKCGFSARQVSSLPSSFLSRLRAILLTVELFFWVVVRLDSPLTKPPRRQVIRAAGQLPQLSQRAVTGLPARISSSDRLTLTTAGFTVNSYRKFLLYFDDIFGLLIVEFVPICVIHQWRLGLWISSEHQRYRRKIQISYLLKF